MATTLDPCGCTGSTSRTANEDAALPIAPFTAIQYHFGMLLGVDDLETAQAYPRGKVRLHNAWLHREGVVWGLDVRFNERRELSVTPGLALDAAGRELHLDAVACVDLGKWFAKHQADPDFTFEDRPNGAKRFDAHVVARFKACLARPVPAIADPCAGDERDTAFSRVDETVELLLRPGLAPAKDRGWHRLRILFALEDDAPAFAEVQARREAILAMALGDQPRAYLAAFREFAALDAIDLRPQLDAGGEPSALVPEDPTEVVLADVPAITVRPGGPDPNGYVIADPLPVPNVRVRPAHVATAAIQELLCGPLFAVGAPGTPPPAPPPAPDAGGPRVDPATVRVAARRRIVLGTNKPLDRESVRPSQFSVTAYTHSDGWHTLDIANAFPDTAGTLITIDLKESVTAGSTARVIAKGTGPTPLLGTDLVPLAGSLTDPPSTINDGRDFVIMLRRG
jgi:hypothetical protein